MLGVTQPRISDLFQGRIHLFSVDTLIGMLARAGVRFKLVVGSSTAYIEASRKGAVRYKTVAKTQPRLEAILPPEAHWMIDLRGGCRQILFCNIHEEISDGLYDYPHRIHRFVHVWTEMASISGEKMCCLASLCRGEYRPILLRKRKRAPLSRHIRNKSDCPENPRQPAKCCRVLPFQV